MTPQQVEAALAPYICRENDAWLHHESPTAMMLAELLQHEKIAGPEGRLRLTLEKADGAPFTLDLTPANPGTLNPGNWVAVEEELRIPPPLYRKEFKPFYGYAWLPDARALYIQYNKCQDDPQKSFATFIRELFAFSDTQPVQRVIVDLRFNGGGNSAIVQPLLDGLKSRPALHAAGQLYVLIGGGTFSSGMMAAIDFQQKLQALLVGRPTGGKPNCYGEVKSLELPNSKLTVQYSLKHFRLLSKSDPSSLEPDILVPITLHDFLAGRDPDLEAALHR
jgi:C-terminal processing protease CtpA/Prc